MKKVHLLHFGIGNVGSELARQIQSEKSKLKTKFDIDLVYCGLFTADAGLFKSNF